MNLLEVDFNKLCSILGTDLEKGLDAHQVIANREEFGSNDFHPNKRNLIDVLRHIFSDIMVIMLFIVAFISFIQSGFSKDVFFSLLAIMIIIAFNFLSYFYEKQNDRKISKFVSDKYHVKRAGKIISVDKRDIVSGDLLILEKGDVMPCDGIILKQKTLRLLEANVTGRREPIIKRNYDDVHNSGEYPYFECVIFAGSVVLCGRALVFVCNTGKNIFDNENFTFLRQISFYPKIYQTASYLKKQIYLISVLLCFLIFCWGIYFNQKIFDTFAFSIALAVSAFPDAIECFSDISLSYMKKKLFDIGCIMRNAGCIDMLCDVNSVFVHSSEYLYHKVPDAGNYIVGNTMYKFSESPRFASDMLECLILTQNNLSDKYKSTDSAKLIEEKVISDSALKAGINKKRVEKENMYVSRYAYDNKRGYSCSLVMNGSGYKLIVRGNPDFILPLCSRQYFISGDADITDASIKNINNSYKMLSGTCEKVYAVAVKNIDCPLSGDQRELCNDMVFMGMFGLYMPISLDSANSVSLCEKAEINTYLMTNDYPESCNSLAKSLSLYKYGDYPDSLNLATYHRMNKGVFIADIEKYKVFCKFPPEDKQNIIRYHKDEGNITCSITTDLYDTLPQMESDISFVDSDCKFNSVKLNSDFLMKKKNYSLVPSAINWARTVYKNIVHIMQYILTLQFAVCLTSFICLATDKSLVFNSSHIILLCLMMAIPATFNIALKKPGYNFESNVSSVKDRISSIQVLIIIPIFLGILIALVTSISYQITLFSSASSFAATNSAFITFSTSVFLISLSLKNESSFFKNISNLTKVELYTFLLNLVFDLLFLFTPLSKICFGMSENGYPKAGFINLLIAVLISFIPFGIREITKVINFKKK